MDASPAKRRVLGALDPNTCSPNPKARHDGKLSTPALSPVKLGRPFVPRQTETTARERDAVSKTPEWDAESRKRSSPSSLGMVSREVGEGEPVAKRVCLDDGAREAAQRGAEVRGQSPPSTSTTTRHRSASPDTSSVFDTSAVDNSQVTILTEPDASGPAPAPPAVASLPPRPRARLTREQAREKAEILRLRLGLASYKVRTNQTDVPLDRLEMRHLGPSQALSRPGSFSYNHNPPHRDQGATSASASFPGTGAHATSGGGRGTRRPLPGAPLRRESSSLSVGSAAEGSAAEQEHGERQEGGLGAGGGADRLDQHQQPQRQNLHSHHQHQHQHQHQRRQSEVVGTRRYAEAGVPPRPRTATDGVAALGQTGKGSLVADGEEEDLEGRGGAASGLLSLARS